MPACRPLAIAGLFIALAVLGGACEGGRQPAAIPASTPTAETKTATPVSPSPTANPTEDGATLSSPTPVSGADFAVARSLLQRNVNPNVSISELADLTSGIEEFAIGLYRSLSGTEGNLFFSPYSVSVALAMVYAGAAGSSADEIASTLHFGLPPDRLNAGFNALALQLADRASATLPKDPKGNPPQLHLANALWAEQTRPILPTFLDALALDYDAGVHLVDFVRDPESAREAINQWAEAETENRITELVPARMITDLTRLVLANAIWFKATWAEPFESRLTSPGSFRALDGRQLEVPMMHTWLRFPYAEVDGVQVVELPYAGDQLSMVVVVPADDNFLAFESSLDRAALDRLLGGLDKMFVDLALPRFEFGSSFRLRDTLTTLGMNAPFSPGVADFSGIDGSSGDRGLFIQDVAHQAFVSVDESGTEATAATAVLVGGMGPSPETAILTVDRPFVFLIRDIPTGTILFMGRVTDPNQ